MRKAYNYIASAVHKSTLNVLLYPNSKVHKCIAPAFSGQLEELKVVQVVGFKRMTTMKVDMHFISSSQKALFLNSILSIFGLSMSLCSSWLNRFYLVPPHIYVSLSESSNFDFLPMGMPLVGSVGFFWALDHYHILGFIQKGVFS